jgi:hypothetical protein
VVAHELHAQRRARLLIVLGHLPCGFTQFKLCSGIILDKQPRFSQNSGLLNGSESGGGLLPRWFFVSSGSFCSPIQPSGGKRRQKMGAIQTFSVRLITSDEKHAGTDGDVYVGLCGREFYIDSGNPNTNDFEQGSDRTYIFGAGANVGPIKYRYNNDPRKDYPIYTEHIDLTPAYIRFGPQNRTDEWILESATVNVNNGEVALQALDGSDRLWLSTHTGLYCYLWAAPILLRRKRTAKNKKAKGGKVKRRRRPSETTNET